MTEIASAVTCEFLNFFKDKSHLTNSSDIAVAVSGGPDSMALLSVLIEGYSHYPTIIHVLTVNHGLRPEAKAEALMVHDWIARLGNSKVRHRIIDWVGEKPDTALMQEARKARYGLMAEYCHEYSIPYLFVAHHLDDQMETFLIRLSKGSGLDGLAAMQESTSYNEKLYIIRPLLSLSKADLETYCKDKSVPYVQDPSNHNSEYLRPRVRSGLKELQTLLEIEGLTAKRIGVLTKRLSRARHALEIITEEQYARMVTIQNNQEATILYPAWRALPEEIAFRLVQKAVAALQSEEREYGVRMERLENLFEALWHHSEVFKPRTLGGLVFALTNKNQALYIRREK